MTVITKDTVVELTYRVAQADGKLIEETKEPMAYLHGGYNGTLPRIEEALEGQKAGHQVTLTLTPEEGFGERDESLVREIPKSEFPPGVKVGGQLEGRSEDGEEHLYRVVKIKGPVVQLDGNHPLAGLTVKFTLKVLSVRPASAEEVTHGHAHGAHGHHH